MSGRIIYEEGYAGETALLIRVPEKGLGWGGGIIEARAGEILKFGRSRKSRKGKGRRGKKKKKESRRPKRAGWNRRRLAGLEL